MRRRAGAVLLVLAALAAPVAARAADWPRFGVDAARTSASDAPTGITAASLGRLRRQRIQLDGTVDSSPIYLARVPVGGAAHDVFVVTTTYGKTIALDARTGAVLWRFVPPGLGGWQGSAQITNATPIADPERRFVYAASPDGRVHKLLLGSGREVRSGGWPASVTRDPTREKIAASLNLSGRLLLVTTGGYIGDAPSYQGHVVAIDRGSGAVVHVWNSLCSDRHAIIVPRTCPASGSAIWGRSGAVVDPATGELLVATGNGPWNGSTQWGDSMLVLSPDAARLLRNFTPANEAALNAGDVDLGSTAPAVLPGTRLAVQGGKEGLLRLIDVDRPNGRTRSAGPLKGGELQAIRAPGGAQVLTAPAVWRSGGSDWVFVADGGGTAAYVLVPRPQPRLRLVWENGTAGTSPVVAGGLLYVYDPGGSLVVYRPGFGRPLATLPAGPGHWNSPIVADGRIALPEGSANDHASTGVLDVWRLPGR